MKSYRVKEKDASELKKKRSVSLDEMEDALKARKRVKRAQRVIKPPLYLKTLRVVSRFPEFYVKALTLPVKAMNYKWRK